MSDPTFDCGDFLPGRGPFNFPDYIGGGGVGGPGGETGPGIPPGGPNTPPGGGGGGGELPECKCRVFQVGDPVNLPSAPEGYPEKPPLSLNKRYQYYSITITQRCTLVIGGLPADNSADAIQDTLATIQASGGQLLVQDTNGAGIDCLGTTPIPDDPCYNGECPNFYFLWRITVTEGPSTPGGGGGGPSSPGPGGPSIPPGGGPSTPGPIRDTTKRCRCVIDQSTRDESDPVTTGVNSGTNVSIVKKRIVITYEQDCHDLAPGEITNNEEVIAWERFRATQYTNAVVTVGGNPAQRCKNVLRLCDDDLCDDITITIDYEVIRDIPGTTDPDPVEGGGGGGGGGITGVGTQTPGPGPSAPPAGGGGGGATGLGPQTPAQGPISPGAGPASPPTAGPPSVFDPPGGGGGGGQTGVGPQTPGPGPVLPPPPGGGGGGGGGGPSSGGFTPLDPVTPGPGPVLPPPPGGGGGGGGGPTSGGFTPIGPVNPGPPPVPFDPPGGGGGGGGPSSGGPFTPIPPASPGGGLSPTGTGEGPNGPQYPPWEGPPIIVDNGGGSGGGGPILGGITRTEAEGGDAGAYGISQMTLDLNNPDTRAAILASKPTGIQDNEIFVDSAPVETFMVENKAYTKDGIWGTRIDSSVAYYQDRQGDLQDWDSRYANTLNSERILLSLKPDVRKLVKSICNYDGSKLSPKQIESLIGSRVINGNTTELDYKFFEDLANATKKNSALKIISSDSSVVNEVAAMALIEASMFPIAPSGTADKPTLGWSAEKMKNYKVFATDVDKYIPVSVGGEDLKCYINDDQSFIGRSTLKMEDGDYFLQFPGGSPEPVRIYAESEIDHAFTIPERIRQQAVKLLGGDPHRTLEVTLPLSSGAEDAYDLSAPRQDYYFVSGNLSTVSTNPVLGQSRLLNETEMDYTYVPVNSQADLDEINEYIKYKGNNLVFLLDDDDRIFDYLERGATLKMRQTDVISEAPKENKKTPILTRQVPWYMMLVPTNRADMLVFDEQSVISDVVGEDITRQLRVNVSLSKEFATEYNSRFFQIYMPGKDAVDVQGVPDPQTRITRIRPDDPMFSKTYAKREGKTVIEGGPATFERERKPSAVRILTEILTELDDNYGLGLNGIGKSVTEFDVYSRFTLRQWTNLLRKENFNTVKRAFYAGLVREVKIIPAVENADEKISLRKSQLVLRKPDAPEEDKFKTRKTTRSGVFLTPPTKKSFARFELVEEKEAGLVTPDGPPGLGVPPQAP